MSIATPATPADAWEFPPLAPIPFARFRDELLALYEPPLRAPKTLAKMRFTLRIVAGLIGPAGSTADLTPELVGRLIQGRPDRETSSTTHTLVSYLRTACNYARSRGYLRTTPFEFRKRWVRISVAPRKRHHSREDIHRVLETMKAEIAERSGWARWRARRLHALAATVAFTGLRANEAIFLRVEDIDLDTRMILVVPHSLRRLKTEGSAAPVPIPDELAEILGRWLAHRMTIPAVGPRPPADCPYLFPNVTRTNAWSNGPSGHKPLDALKGAGERADVPGFTFLSLRHSYATHAESSWGLSPAMLQRVLRHTTQGTQWAYRHPDASNLRASVRGITFGPTGPAEEGGPES